MENLINVTSLQTISFPVFKLSTERPSVDNGRTSYIRLYHATEEREEYCIDRIVDDITLKGASLSKRRLQAKEAGLELYKLSSAIFFLGDLIKLSTKGMWFIDSNGKLFQYKKHTKAKLKYHPIAQILPLVAGGAIVEVKDIATRYKLLYFPQNYPTYAGILHWGMSTVLYGLYHEKYDESWRMV